MSDHTTRTKQCSKCGNILPATNDHFSRKKRGKYGLSARCKKCDRVYHQARRAIKAEYDRAYREANQERISERCREWVEKNRERHDEYHRAYYQNNKAWWTEYYEANREYIREQNAKRYHANKEYHAEQNRKWRAANPEADRARAQRRKARKLKAEGNYTGEDVQQQYKNQRGLCYYCQVKVGDNYHVDHVVPLSRGGSNNPSNLVVACPSCNMSKSDKMPHEWVQGGRLL